MKVIVMDHPNKPVPAVASRNSESGKWWVVRDGKTYYGDSREEAVDSAGQNK